MDRRELRQTLETLHEELHAAETVSESDRALLEELQADLRRVLDSETEGPEGPHEGLRDRLDQALYELQEDHPQLVASIRNVVNYLSAMGI